MSSSNIRIKILVLLVSLNLAGILLAGLSIKGFQSHNEVERSAGHSGIKFGGRGLAFTDMFMTNEPADHATGGDFTLEIALHPDRRSWRGARIIALIHSGDDSSQLVVWQWRQIIQVMNGDDFDAKRGVPRIAVDVSTIDAESFLLVVKSDSGGSRLYVDGTLVDSNKNLRIKLPTDTTPGRLALGSSVYGTSSWQGEILGYAFYENALPEELLNQHQALWVRDQNFSGFNHSLAFLSYPFLGNSGRSALDHSRSGKNLQFPLEKLFVEPKIFSLGTDGLSLRVSSIWDVLINVAGFMPFGFLLAALLLETSNITRQASLIATILFGVILSFGIELTQAWIPSRSSSLLDLLLNVMGTSFGAGGYALVTARAKRDR